MNRYEFIEKIENMGLHAEYDRYFLYISDKNGFLLSTISTVYQYQFRFYQAGFCGLEDEEKMTLLT